MPAINHTGGPLAALRGNRPARKKSKQSYRTHPYPPRASSIRGARMQREDAVKAMPFSHVRRERQEEPQEQVEALNSNDVVSFVETGPYDSKWSEESDYLDDSEDEDDRAKRLMKEEHFRKWERKLAEDEEDYYDEYDDRASLSDFFDMSPTQQSQCREMLIKFKRDGDPSHLPDELYDMFTSFSSEEQGKLYEMLGFCEWEQSPAARPLQLSPVGNAAKLKEDAMEDCKPTSLSAPVIAIKQEPAAAPERTEEEQWDEAHDIRPYQRRLYEAYKPMTDKVGFSISPHTFAPRLTSARGPWCVLKSQRDNLPEYIFTHWENNEQGWVEPEGLTEDDIPETAGLGWPRLPHPSQTQQQDEEPWDPAWDDIPENRILLEMKGLRSPKLLGKKIDDPVREDDPCEYQL